MTDRVLVNEGRLQEYGTQFHEVAGERRPRPLRDPETVDRRRNAMGMSTLEEYAVFMNT